MHQRFTRPLLLLFLFALGSSTILYGQVQNVDVFMDVIEVRHNYDCGSDGDGIFSGTPEPRWKFWGGYDGGSWSFVGTHKYAFDGGALNCGIWNHSDFDLRNISNNPTRYMSVDMESWEEDGCGGDNDYNDDCWFNDDDAHNSRFRLADIDFRIDPPGVYNQYGWYYGGYGYGARVDVLYTCDDAGDGVAFGTDSWRGYAYDGTSLSGTYYGYMTESENFDQSFGDFIINSEYHPTSCRSFQKETFSVRYKMRKTVTECGYYTIRAGSDDGLRLYVDGTLVIDSWIDRGYTVDQAGVYLEPGTHDFVLEYYENGGGNRISFNIQRADRVPTAGNTDITACCTDLYDAGGSSGNYNNNWDGTTTIYPSDPASILIINGTQTTESGYDFLRIYDGAGTGGTLLHDASGTATISNITASSPGGALTVRFTSDVSVTLPGFDLDVSCCLPSNAPSSISGPSELCSGESATLTVSGGSLGDGADWYWYTSSCGGTVVGTGSSITVSPTSTTTYYVRAEGQCATTACASTTVNVSTIPADPGIGSNEWTVLSYDGTAFGNFRGYYIQPIDHSVFGYGAEDFEFNTAKDGWSDVQSPSNATGYTGCSIPVDNFSFEAKRQGFPCGYYNLVLQYFDDGVRIRVDQDGDGSWELTDDRLGGPCCPGSASTIFSGYLGANSIVQIDMLEYGGNANVHLIFDQLSSTNPPLAAVDDPSTPDDVCQGNAIDLAVNWSSTYGTGAIVEPLSLTWSDGTGSGTSTGLTTSSTISVVPPAGTPTYTFTAGTDGTGCAVNVAGSANVFAETPPSAATINSVAYNCQGNQFALDGAAAAVGSTVWSLVSGPGTVGPGVGPTDGILNTVPLQSTVTVRYSVTTGTGICPDETEDRVINYMTDLAVAADGISTCAPIAGGGLQYFGDASGEKLYVGLSPNGNNLGIVDVELPAGNAFSTPALYWSGLDAPLGSYGGGATDPARMDSDDPSCPDELFVEDTWEIDVATQPTGTDPQVVVYLPRAKWDAFVNDGNTWLDATAGLRTNYLACYNTFPAPSDPPTTTNVTVTGYHADGRSVHPVGDVSYDATGDFYAITFNTDRFSGFALHGSGSGDPLPVTLVQFDGEHIQGDNHLEWITATEQNVSHFVVERSPDGMTYSDLATVEAAGNSTTVQTYSYVDANVPQGGQYYRLRTVDLDGTTDHSQAIWLGAEGGLWAGDFIQVLPNPTTAEAEVRFFLPQAGAYTLRISDAVGRMIQETPGQGQDGLNTVAVDLSQEAAGTYIVAIRRADGRWLKARLIKSTD